jgi:hypothetical protein
MIRGQEAIEQRAQRMCEMVDLQAAGWVVLVAASYEIDHYETFGLKQPL